MWQLFISSLEQGANILPDRIKVAKPLPGINADSPSPEVMVETLSGPGVD